jgi:hypothetical protein
MRKMAQWMGSRFAILFTGTFVALALSSCSVQLPTAAPADRDPHACLLHARHSMDTGDAAAALRWAERGIQQDPGFRWPELRTEAARASFALAGGDFADLLEAAAWVLEGGLLVTQAPSLPQWPADPAGDRVNLPGTARELLERLDWGLVERAAGHLEVVAVSLEEGRIAPGQVANREEDIYLAHSALRLATGLVLLLDPNGNLTDGLQETKARSCDTAGAGCLLDSLLAQANAQIFGDLHRSLLSAENLLLVRSGEPPRGELQGTEADGPPLDPGVPAEAYVGAVRAVVTWMDQAAETAKSPGKSGSGAVREVTGGPGTSSSGPIRLLSWLLDQIVPAAQAQMPLDGSLRRPLVVPLDFGEAAWQPAGPLLPAGWSLGAGEVAWTAGSPGSVRAFLRAQDIVEGAETASTADQLHAAAEASRTLRGRSAFVSVAPLRVGWGLEGLRAGFVPVAEGYAGATTGILGSPEGVGLTALGGDFTAVAQPSVLQLRAATVGLGVRAGLRWVRSTHLQVVPYPRSTGTAWLPRADAELRLGIAAPPGRSALRWGGVVSMPIYSSEPAVLPQFILGSWLAGPALGPLRTHGLAEGTIDRDHAVAKAGVGVAAPHAAIIVLRAAEGWEGELRVGSVAFAMQVARGAMGEPLSIYRLGVSRPLTTSVDATAPRETDGAGTSSFPASNPSR